MNLPQLNTVWIYRGDTNRRYILIGISNEHTERPDEYAVTVEYISTDTGYKWSTSLDDFMSKMTHFNIEDKQ